MFKSIQTYMFGLLLVMLGLVSGGAHAAPVDITLLGTAVDLSTINTTIGAVFISIITVTAFVWAGYKILRMFKGA